MKTVTVDPQHRIRFGAERPQTKFWVFQEPDGYRLQRIPEPQPERKPSRKEIFAALDELSDGSMATWDQIRKEVREID